MARGRKAAQKAQVLYRLSQREQGRLETLQAQAQIMQAQVQRMLQAIMRRENIPATDQIVWSPEMAAFVKAPRKLAAVPQQDQQ